MDPLKSASFSSLFVTTFTVALVFQATLAVVGVIIALVSPHGFTLNGRAASNSVEAVSAVLIILTVCTVLNVAVSAGGAGLWTLIRRFIFRTPAVAN